MCMCGKPTKNGTEKGWPISPPELEEGDVLVFDEPGRCSPQVNGKGNVDYHSHHFRFVENGNLYQLHVMHGGGQETFNLGFQHTRLKEILEKLDSDARFLMLYAFMRFHHEAAQKARTDEMWKYRTAFAEGRLKKRKHHGQDGYKIWIEDR